MFVSSARFLYVTFIFFFFKQKTAYEMRISDWSSDVCSSDLKKTPEDVAKRFGLTERFVRSRLRLADLADPIFEALRNGEITLNVAVAYASNSDRTKQAEVFELPKDGYYRANVNEIKRQLVEDTYVGSVPKALLEHGRASCRERRCQDV